MQNSTTTTTPNDQWFIDKHRGSNQVLAFNQVYVELRRLFGDLQRELNQQSVNTQNITDLSIKIASIVNKVKSIIESKQDRSLTHRVSEFNESIKALMSNMTSAMQTNIQFGQFDRQINNITDDAESLVDMQLTYHNYANDISGALMAEERPQIQLSIEHMGLRKNLTKKQRIKYFEADGSDAFPIHGEVNEETLGKYFTLSTTRVILRDNMYSSKEDTKNRERIFHHYIGFAMLLQIAKQDHGGKMMTIGQKQISVQQYIDVFIDIVELTSFTNNFVESVSYHPRSQDGDKSIYAFSAMYSEHAFKIIQAMFP